jgi:hypothetical protein
LDNRQDAINDKGNVLPDRSRTCQRSTCANRTAGRRRAPIALLLVALACLGLTACSSSSDPSAAAAPSAREARAYDANRIEARQFVSCARRHRIDLPEPDVQNRVKIPKVDLKDPRSKATIDACFQKAVSQGQTGATTTP